MARRKEIFEKRKDAIKAKEEKSNAIGFGVYKIKFGRNKGKYFVGSHIDYLNRF